MEIADTLDVSQEPPTLRQKTLDKWEIPWQEFDMAFGHVNLFNVRNLNILHLDRAGEFLKNAGFDLSEAESCRQFDVVFGEALYILRHVLFTQDERALYVVPAEILHISDRRSLPVLASQRSPRRRYVRLWACALLKLMYAITNLEFSGRLRELHLAREQIFGRIRSLLTPLEEGGWRIQHGDLSVDLPLVEWKEAKTRHSIVLKLLHKPESIVDEVFDYLGVRLVCHNTGDLPRLIRILIDADILIPHQVIGVRTRNTLLNVKRGRQLLGLSSDLLRTGAVSSHEFEDLCQNIPWNIRPEDETRKGSNSFTSNSYRSVQFTVRHLVRTPNPAFGLIASLNRQVRHLRGLDAEEDWIPSMIPSTVAHYFPIELQLMDKSAVDVARFGPASHEQYKASQLKVVRERVLGGLLFMTPEKLSSQEF